MNRRKMMVRQSYVRIGLTLLVAVAASCGGSVDDKGSGGPKKVPTNNTSNNQTSNNQSSNNQTSNNGDNNMTPINNGVSSCGDGVLDPGELCDPGIAGGAGACPTSCSAPACASASLVGSAEQCTAQCMTTPVACADGDGCCPAGCDGANDNDCSNVCGDGVTEGPETCDGNCPTACDDQDACTTNRVAGDPAMCNVSCEFAPIAACLSGDGCCPSGCTDANDNDCEPAAPMCGDGVLDAGELCDGNCPTSCNDQNACTRDQLTGSAATCNAQCSSTPITSCSSGDGCCPSGCTFQNDSDCACVPKTCAQLGAECGTISDGCGGTVTCTNTCTTSEACQQNTCVSTTTNPVVGTPCSDYPQCGGDANNAACILPPDWPSGYCTHFCDSNGITCPTGSHCAQFDLFNQVCMTNCTTNADCRSGYVCEQYDGTGSKECVPPNFDPGGGAIGDACSSDADCDSGLCSTAFDANGVCTQTCEPLAGQCPSYATCTITNECMPKCAVDSDCRAGYVCLTGLPLIEPYCFPGSN